MRDRIRNIPYWVYDFLSLLSAIITIISAVFAFIKGVVAINRMEEGTYSVSWNPVLLCLCGTLFCCVCVLGIKVKKYGSLKVKMRYAFSYEYYQFLHDFRNTYFDILKNHKVMETGNKENMIERLTEDTKNFLQDALDYLCNILEANSGEKISGCIKLIENTGNVTNIDKEKATVITFCRSKNSDTVRVVNDENTENKSISIKRNTDFYDILDEESNNTNSYFYQTDLLQYAKDLEKAGKVYRNTTEHFEKYYRGTIVAPIRIKRSRLYYLNDSAGYDIIGFLCVDSLSVNAFRNKRDEKNDYSNIVKAFAAEIYIVLNKYNYYLRKINGG